MDEVESLGLWKDKPQNDCAELFIRSSLLTLSSGADLQFVIPKWRNSLVKSNLTFRNML